MTRRVAARCLRAMYGFEHDPDDDDAASPRSLLAEIAVLLIPAAIMVAGFAVALLLR